MREGNVNSPVKILMSAINGYGHYYLKTLLEEVSEEDAILAGVIDPEADKSGYYSLILENHIPIFKTMEEYFDSGLRADLTVISSPPQYHVSQSLVAIKNGSYVLVDKPVGVSVKSVEVLLEISEKYNKWVEVGYQWSFSNAITELKRDILLGVYGKPEVFKTICLWPRPYDYFERNSWAGKVKDPNGRVVLDSPANNACAHFLHNLLFLLGKDINSSAMPLRVDGTRYRAYDIENYDTISLRIQIDGGAEVLFYASHVTESDRNPEFSLEFDKGRVEFVWGGEIIGIFPDGSKKQYGSPEDDSQFKKLHDSIRKVRDGGPDICSPEAAIAQTKCINMIHESGGPIIKFPDDIIVESETRRWVKGLKDKIDKAYTSGTMINFK